MNKRISIRRYDPETDAEPRWVDYAVPSGERTTVLEALAYVYENIDPTLAFRSGCRFDSCGLCAVELNGRPRMACSAWLEDGMKIAPLHRMPVLRDLVIDRARFFEGLRELRRGAPDIQSTRATCPAGQLCRVSRLQLDLFRLRLRQESPGRALRVGKAGAASPGPAQHPRQA
jgi:succinate dehydrogenase/fumarate reductase iron-sulfur protein